MPPADASDDDDIFADSDSDNTADLIASTKAATAKAPPAKKKKVVKKKAAAKGNDSDSDGKGLFDSDSDDEPVLSKREKLAKLARKKASVSEPARGRDKKASRNEKSKNKANDGDKKSGYESEESYDSAEFQRTKEDDDFLDTTGEDPDAVNELYAEQHFGADTPMDDIGSKKKKRKYNRRDEAIEDNGDPDDPMSIALSKFRKTKREKKSFTETEDEVKIFLDKMERAAEQDEISMEEKKPATKKLAMLTEVVDMLTRKDMQRMLLDNELLSVCKRWVQPLPNGKLGNVTIRQRLLATISSMNGENGINANDLKRSEFGKVVMVLYKHPQETDAMRRQLKGLIEQWSRPIFQKSGNMRDLARVSVNRGAGGLAGISRQQAMANRVSNVASTSGSVRVTDPNDLQSMIATGTKSSEAAASANRVRVPFSRGFDYTVRPMAKSQTNSSGGASKATGDTEGTRSKLAKRMLEKNRTVSKNQRSVNISIEGRRTKG